MNKYFAVFFLMLMTACSSTETPQPVETTTYNTPETAQKTNESSALANTVETLPDANMLIGQTPRIVQNAIGEPSLVRRDGNVQIILYKKPECVFEVIFYEPSENDHFTATDINARTADGKDTDIDLCLNNILPAGSTLDLKRP